MNQRELRNTVTSFRSGILQGREPARMCYAVCAPLQGFLKALGVQTELMEGEVETDVLTNHYWLKLADGRIIDPTASQFTDPFGVRMPKVYIGPVPTWYDSMPWQPLFDM